MITKRIARAVEETPECYRLSARLDGCEKPA
jgi:hypothetical protein